VPCLHCASAVTAERPQRTSLGYRTFRCCACRRVFNERTGTPFNHLQYPTDLVLLVVLWRLRYTLSLRDLAEMFVVRGLTFTHETVREWEERFAPLLAEHLCAKRRGRTGRSWYIDEAYFKVDGRWCYLYRAIDRDGILVELLLSETRDMAAAQHFLRQALETAGRRPEKVTTDGHDAYPRAVREVLGEEVGHRTSRYLTNRIEQDHRPVKQRYYPMCGFKTVRSAARFCAAHEEQRQSFRTRQRTGEQVSLAEHRWVFQKRWASVLQEVQAA
jgi:putative transposase